MQAGVSVDQRSNPLELQPFFFLTNHVEFVLDDFCSRKKEVPKIHLINAMYRPPLPILMFCPDGVSRRERIWTCGLVATKQDGSVPTRAQQQPGAKSSHAREDASPYSRDGARRPVSSPAHEWDSKMQPLPGPPLRRRSQVGREARDHEEGVNIIYGGTGGGGEGA